MFPNLFLERISEPSTRNSKLTLPNLSSKLKKGSIMEHMKWPMYTNFIVNKPKEDKFEYVRLDDCLCHENHPRNKKKTKKEPLEVEAFSEKQVLVWRCFEQKSINFAHDSKRGLIVLNILKSPLNKFAIHLLKVETQWWTRVTPFTDLQLIQRIYNIFHTLYYHSGTHNPIFHVKLDPTVLMLHR